LASIHSRPCQEIAASTVPVHHSRRWPGDLLDGDGIEDNDIYGAMRRTGRTDAASLDVGR